MKEGDYVIFRNNSEFCKGEILFHNEVLDEFTIYITQTFPENNQKYNTPNVKPNDIIRKVSKNFSLKNFNEKHPEYFI